MTLDDLNRRFALPGLLRFDPGRGDLTRARITHPTATGELYLHGAHVTAWQPIGERAVLWMSEQSRFQPDQPIRGGIPLCFPWFGPKADDPEVPSHGLARLTTWDVADTAHDDRGVTLRLITSIQPSFRVVYTVTFGQVFEMSLTITNSAAEVSRFEAALHTYFAVSDVRQVWVTGLEGIDYRDSLAGRQMVPGGPEPITFTGEIDRIYQDAGPAVTIVDPAWGRAIRVAKRGSGSTVVWNPWVAKAARMADFGDDEWPGMLCIETANVVDQAVMLQPGARHEMSAALSITTPAV